MSSCDILSDSDCSRCLRTARAPNRRVRDCGEPNPSGFQLFNWITPDRARWWWFVASVWRGAHRTEACNAIINIQKHRTEKHFLAAHKTTGYNRLYGAARACAWSCRSSLSAFRSSAPSAGERRRRDRTALRDRHSPCVWRADHFVRFDHHLTGHFRESEKVFRTTFRTCGACQARAFLFSKVRQERFFKLSGRGCTSKFENHRTWRTAATAKNNKKILLKSRSSEKASQESETKSPFVSK